MLPLVGDIEAVVMGHLYMIVMCLPHTDEGKKSRLAAYVGALHKPVGMDENCFHLEIGGGWGGTICNYTNAQWR